MNDLEEQAQELTTAERRFLIYMAICSLTVWISGAAALIAIFWGMRP